jgi:hypothetical protein
MNTKHNKWPLTLSTIFLTACGADVASVYSRSLYHTNLFNQNHYVDTVLTTTFAAEKITQTSSVINFETDDVNQEVPTNIDDVNGDAFAFNNKLSLALPSLNYGIESKLFDGILYCTDAQRLSKSRLQLLPTGMGYRFSKPILSSPSNTVGLFMKAGADTDGGASHISSLVVHLSLYQIDGDGYEKIDLNIPIDNLVPSFYPGFYQVSLPEGLLENTIGFGFRYTIVSPIPSNDLQTLTGIFLYEVLFPSAGF